MIQHFSNNLDTKYKAENFTDTSSDTNPHRHMVVIINQLLLYKYIYKGLSANLNVLIRCGFLATNKLKI